PRLAGAAQAGAMQGDAHRQGLRHARRREGRRRAGARTPADAAAGALGRTDPRRRRRPRAARDGADAARRGRRPGPSVTRAAAPKLGAYAGLAGLGLLAALVLGRPELVAFAAPFAAVVALGLVLGGEPQLTIRTTLDR